MLFVIKHVRCATAREAEVAQGEVNLLRSMSCPSVLGYIDSFMHKDCLCIVTEYCPGGDLYQRLKREQGNVAEETVIDWFLQTTQALAHLHERDVMHRDLKVRGRQPQDSGADASLQIDPSVPAPAGTTPAPPRSRARCCSAKTYSLPKTGGCGWATSALRARCAPGKRWRPPSLCVAFSCHHSRRIISLRVRRERRST